MHGVRANQIVGEEIASQMGLTEEVLRLITDKAADDIRTGLRYTAVRIGERVGLARTMHGQCQEQVDARGFIQTKLAHLVSSDRPMEASIGAAAINAQITPGGRMTTGDIFERIIEMANRSESTAVVGWFPFIRHLTGKVYVFEKRPREGCLPASEAESILPGCDLVVITGSAFVNKTLERLLEISGGYTMVIGPSTPLCPVLFDFGADLLAGVVSKAEQVLDIVGQDGGTRDFTRFVERIIMESG